jgi:protein-L-isoaspartate(D-aspartate) O-methyltransferase
MIKGQLVERGILDPRVLEAMHRVPRHLFVPSELASLAYSDGPLPIGEGQTISQPYIVAYMTEAARLSPADRVLEIGTGSGYQTAILCELVSEVYTIEVNDALAAGARERLRRMGYTSAHFRAGDGYLGWPERAPFDAIVVTAAPPDVPGPLVEQLKPGGRLIVPVGASPEAQSLLRLTRTATGLGRESILPVRFVPMVGLAQEARKD